MTDVFVFEYNNEKISVQTKREHSSGRIYKVGDFVDTIPVYGIQTFYKLMKISDGSNKRPDYLYKPNQFRQLHYPEPDTDATHIALITIRANFFCGGKLEPITDFSESYIKNILTIEEAYWADDLAGHFFNIMSVSKNKNPENDKIIERVLSLDNLRL